MSFVTPWMACLEQENKYKPFSAEMAGRIEKINVGKKCTN